MIGVVFDMLWNMFYRKKQNSATIENISQVVGIDLYSIILIIVLHPPEKYLMVCFVQIRLLD